MHGGAHDPARKPRLPRRRTVMLMGAGALGAATVATRAAAGPVPADAPTAEAGSVAETSPLRRFGFLIEQPAEDPPEMVAQSMNEVTALGMGWVRFGIAAFSAVTSWDAPDGGIDFAPEALQKVSDAIDAAHAHGLKVCLMIIDVYPIAEASEEHFVLKMRQFWTHLGRELGSRADTIQIFNEPDGAHYRTFTDVGNPPTTAYLTELAGRLVLAREVIRAVAPDARITTNIFGYPVDTEMERRWHRVLDILSPGLDLITVDAYPQLDVEDIEDLPHKLGRLAERYGKPVSVGELGLNTCAECGTEDQQAAAYGMYTDALRDDSVAESVFFYQLRDGDPVTPDTSFGVISRDGSVRKPAWDVLAQRSRPV